MFKLVIRYGTCLSSDKEGVRQPRDEAHPDAMTVCPCQGSSGARTD